MRRPLTITFDEDFIARMDRERGPYSRGAWIEAHFAGWDSALAAEGLEQGQALVDASGPVGQSRSEAFRKVTQRKTK